MKYLKNSNSRIRLVQLENGSIGFAAKVAPLVQDGRYWIADRAQAVFLFYPAELIVAGQCTLTECEIFGYEAECENETHYFPSFEALGEETIELSCEDAYLFSSCDFRQNNPVVGVHVKEAPSPNSFVYAIRKGVDFVPLQEMQEGVRYELID